MDFFTRTGKMAIGSRLRLLSERLMSDAQEVYKLYEVDLKPKWFPVFFLLAETGERSITAIAEEIGHTHPSVSTIVREMSRNGIVSEKKDPADKRKTVVSLTEKGRRISRRIQNQYLDVGSAVEEMVSRTNHNLWEAIAEFEFLLDQKSMLYRVREHKKKREAEKITVVPYQPKYRESFRQLNEEWIEAFFHMEEADYQVLDHPQEYILDKGGYILVALDGEEPVGVCALIKMNPDSGYDFELAKMAVSPKAQGKGVGSLLGKATLEKARALGAKNIYLGSNTILKPALNLYLKLGFKKVTGLPSPYERCNIHMALELT